MNNTSSNTQGQSVPFAVHQPYQGDKFVIFGTLSADQQRELIDRGFRRDKVNRQLWWVADKKEPKAIASFDEVVATQVAA